MRSGKSSDASKQSNVRAPKRFIYRLYCSIAWILTKLLFRVRYVRDPRITREGGPYFVVGNHVSYLDPIFCLLALDKLSIRFVAGIEVTSGRLLKKLLAPLAMIPIKPFRVSYSTTREIIASIRSGLSVALYPETQRSIAGDLTPFGLSTAKLIRHLRVPVVSVLARGGYLGWPRWAKMFRPGHVELETRLLFTAEETAELSLDDIQDRLTKAITTEDYDWQLRRRRPVRYFSMKPAQGLARICHWCPACDRPLSMESGKHRLSCRHCGQAFRLDLTGFFTAAHGSRPYFDHPLEFAKWQSHRLERALEEGEVLSNPCRIEFHEHLIEDGVMPEKTIRQGVCKLVRDGILFTDEHEHGEIFFPLGETPALYTSIGLFADVSSDGMVWRLYPESEGFTSMMTDFARIVWKNRMYSNAIPKNVEAL